MIEYVTKGGEISMMIFAIKKTETVIIPSQHIFKVHLLNKTLTIVFDSGESVMIDDGTGRSVAVPKVSTFQIIYDSIESAQKKIRSYYTACKNNDNVFIF